MKKFFAPTRAVRVFAIAASLVLAACVCASAQVGSQDRDSARTMLDSMKKDLQKNYYDPTLRGMDVEARFKAADEKLKAAQTRDQLVITVAQFVLDLDDSHTFFVPPSRAASVEYGWQMRAYGDDCFVTAVKPKSDAEAKGLKVGDRLVAVDGFKPTRDNMWKVSYRYYALMPSRVVRLKVQSPGDAEPRDIEVAAKVERGAVVTDWEKIFLRSIREDWDVVHEHSVEVGSDLMIWQMPSFEVSPDHVDAVMGKARKFKTLVIDLRGNGGGYVKTLEQLAGYFFDSDVKMSDLKGRKETKPSTAKTRGSDGFKGRLVVLVDSDSASASEVFARVIQLEKRGTVIGDRTAGKVMTSRFYGHETGVGNVLYYGASVTVADVIMSDGKSLEKTGVTPDELLLPTAADLAAQRDPVLSRAAAIAGVELTPEKAGTLFPVEWKK